jgi:hypothetical protein
MRVHQQLGCHYLPPTATEHDAQPDDYVQPVKWRPTWLKAKQPRSYVVWTPEQLGRAKMFLKRVAPELQDVEKFDPKEHASHIVGKRARLKINIKPNRDGEDQNNVADVLAPAGGGGDGFNL